MHPERYCRDGRPDGWLWKKRSEACIFIFTRWTSWWVTFFRRSHFSNYLILSMVTYIIWIYLSVVAWALIALRAWGPVPGAWDHVLILMGPSGQMVARGVFGKEVIIHRSSIRTSIATVSTKRNFRFRLNSFAFSGFLGIAYTLYKPCIYFIRAF